MKTADFRKQTAAVSNPGASILTLWASVDILFSTDNPCNVLQVGATWRAEQQATTVVSGATAGLPLLCYGTSGRYCGEPRRFLPVVGPTGERLAIPAYLRIN